MPVFESLFSGLTDNRKSTGEELIRAISFSAARENETTQVYMRLAESVVNKLAAKILKDVTDKERVNMRKFLTVPLSFAR